MVEFSDRRSAGQRETSLSHAFHALSDPSRRRIIELLREAGELKVGDVAGAFSMSLNGVSKHLKVLEQAELITRRVEGRLHFIRVRWANLQAPYEWLHFYQHYWSERLDALIDYVEADARNTRATVSKPALSPVSRQRAASRKGATALKSKPQTQPKPHKK